MFTLYSWKENKSRPARTTPFLLNERPPDVAKFIQAMTVKNTAAKALIVKPAPLTK